MKTIKILLYRFIPAAAVLLLAGCTQLFQNPGGTVSSGTDGYSTVNLVLAPSESTPAVSASAASTALARSAYPSSLDSSMRYTVTALESGASSSIDCPVLVNNAVLSFPLLSGKTWDITVTAYDLTDMACQKPLLTGTMPVTLNTNQTSVTATLSLLPADGSTGTGTINLKMADGTAGGEIDTIKAVYYVGGTLYTKALTGSSSSGWMFSHGTGDMPIGAPLAAGIYDVVFYFYKSGSTKSFGFYPDKIAVYPGLPTDKWYIVGSTGSDTLTVTDDMLHTPDPSVLYVSGSSPEYLAAGSDDTGDGTLAKPFATLGKALTALDNANDGTSSYTIYVDGTLTETEQTVDGSASGYCERIYPTNNNLILSIIGISDAAVLDASSAVSSTGNIDLLYVTSGTENYTVNLTLKDLTLKCPPGTSDYKAYGIFTQSYYGSGSQLTLTDCTVGADSDYACPVCILPGEDSCLPLTLTGKTAVNASGPSLFALRANGVVTLDSTDISVTGKRRAVVGHYC